jgi:hypothetical protein
MLQTAGAGFQVLDNYTSSSVPGSVGSPTGTQGWDWANRETTDPRPPTAQEVGMFLIPGDTVRFPVQMTVNLGDGSAFTGTLRMRWEVLVTVPEPSAALSLPIGVLVLAGLASLKGGA